MIESVIINVFYADEFSEKVYLPCDAFYIGSLVGLSRKNIVQWKKKKKIHVKNNN